MRKARLRSLCDNLGKAIDRIVFSAGPDQLVLREDRGCGMSQQIIDCRLDPSCMNSAKTLRLNKQRQPLHPAKNVLGVRRAQRKFSQKAFVLLKVPFVMRTQRHPCLGISHMEVNRVELMIAHDGLGTTSIHQFAHDSDDGTVLGTTIDKVAQENDLTIGLGMEPCRTLSSPAQVLQGKAQLLGLTVDVGDYVGSTDGEALLVRNKSVRCRASEDTPVWLSF